MIAGVLASTIACGWLLGIEESLCLVIISGICVDYVLHIACAYSQAYTADGDGDDSNSSARRVRAAEVALKRMGSPLFCWRGDDIGRRHLTFVMHLYGPLEDWPLHRVCDDLVVGHRTDAAARAACDGRMRWRAGEGEEEVSSEQVARGAGDGVKGGASSGRR